MSKLHPDHTPRWPPRLHRNNTRNFHHTLGRYLAQFWRRSIIGQEGADHRRLRNLAVPVLSDIFIAGMRPAIDRIAADLCAGMTRAETCEFQSAFAILFAGQAICTLLGLPRAEWQTISQDASDLGLAMGVECKRHEPIFDAACARLTNLARDLVYRARRGDDTSSYVAGLVARADADSEVDETALLDLIVISIFGGVDTTRSQLGLGLAMFIDHPAQWQALRADPRLVSNAVEEIIRARPTTTWVTREAVEDFAFGGERIARGTVLHMLVHASARDPAIHDDTDHAGGFDITVRRRRHFGFGGGAHHCIGHLVARTDIACALTVLLRTLETIAYDGSPVWLPDSGNTSAERLPIRYTLSGPAMP